MNFIVYDQYGSILRTGSCSPEYLELQAQTNEFVIEGIANDNTQYIENSEIKNFTAEELELKNNSPFGYKWQMPDKTLVKYLSDEDIYNYHESIILNKQKQLLAETDWTQTNDQSDIIKNIWKPYRESLRNIIYCPNYPFKVIWPHKPY